MVFGRRFRLADFSIEYGISSCYFGYFSFFQYSYYRKERILDIDIFYFEAIIVLDKTVLFRTIIAVFYGRSVSMYMKNASDMLLLVRYMMKLYEKHLENVQMKYQLSHIEIAIIGFLYNNPEKDTAADIVERRMLPKGNVSAGVEMLVQKELLIRRQDQADSRKIH